MLIRNFAYKGVSLSDDVAQTTHIVLNEDAHDVKLRTETYSKQNEHGAYSSNTLADGRLFTFSGYIFGVTKADRYIGQQLLESIIVPEAYPSDTNGGNYTLTFTDDGGNNRQVSAKVYSLCTFEHEIAEPITKFTFSLYSDDPRIMGLTEKTGTGGVGHYGGFTLPMTLPDAWDGVVGKITLSNSGNFPAFVNLTAVGTLVNPRFVCNGRWYKLNTTTTNLQIKNYGGKLVVTDNGVDITAFRVSGSRPVFLDPGASVMYLEADNWATATATVTVKCYDTYM